MKQLELNPHPKQLKEQLSIAELRYEQAVANKKNYVIIKRLRERIKKLKGNIQMLHA